MQKINCVIVPYSDSLVFLFFKFSTVLVTAVFILSCIIKRIKAPHSLSAGDDVHKLNTQVFSLQF